MDPKKCARVPMREFHGRIHGNHIGGHIRGIRTSLNPELIKLYALQMEKKIHKLIKKKTS